ncbi:hypothetical protein HTZ97_00325 [Desulfuromonas acetoxidans]|uniref:multiheme c-type cytochrome n=1 Tax=Desulfuromonas acetoxidans TaxID=891 RepID=UPI0015937DAF|nr:multiheme c-type cytochrome [Desulfuromonas acetoxidans]MBF0645636.1 hypothetical protein [Desulfuromonas acetoxidans]NVE14914.1 hypothetical protein [Desulfuromonas acetoxidans]
MKVKHWFSFFVVLSSILLLTACGSNSGSGGDQSAAPAEDDLGSDTDTGISYVGAATCIGCHEDFSWSSEEVADYLAGAHVIHSDHITQADAADGCLDCHDPIGDGPGLESMIDAANVPADGLAAVGCEACHGAGGDHYGVGPIPMAEPGIAECAACHDELPESHLTYHPEANNIGTNYVASRHYTASVRNEAVCSRCHTDLGGRLYKDVTTKTQLEASVFAVESDEAVQCRTCHNPHNAGGLLFEEVEDHGHVVASGEYATCTSCHMSDSGSPDDAEWMYHEDVYYRIITDTHYDDPTTTDVIEGYVVNPLSERACRDCHDVHAVEEIRADDDSSSFSNTINDQWARSGHAGELGDIKLEVAEFYGDEIADGGLDQNRTIAQSLAIKEAGSLGADNAFPHYDWDAQNRQSCQECHTATGFKNYTADPTTYDAANNDFSHLADWAVDGDGIVTSSGQNELLYCWGCHSDNQGALYASGDNTMSYSYDGVAVVIPDIGNSNTCIHCHGGRNNVDNLKDASRSSRFEGHHGPAAGTLFSSVTHLGYEFDGQSYANVSYFHHADIGTIDADGNEVYAGTGTSGPCVGCHMADSDHTFAVVEEDEVTGEITSITSFETCAACHNTTDPAGDHYFDASVLEEEKLGFEEAIMVLENYITNTTVNTLNVDLTADSPTLDPDGNGVDEFLAYYETVAIDYYGTYQNYKYMDDEPGAYAHNRYYAKRLLFDSIDLLQHGSLTGSITIDEAVYADAAMWFGADADTNLAARP